MAAKVETAPVVCDASPLIALAWLEQLQLLPLLFDEIVIPVAVRKELFAIPDAPGMTELDSANWLHVQKVSQPLAVQLLRNQLGAGESEAIVRMPTFRRNPPLSSNLTATHSNTSSG